MRAAFVAAAPVKPPRPCLSPVSRRLIHLVRPIRPALPPRCALNSPTNHQRRQLDRDIFALATPALGALALDPLLSLIDTAFVGRLGVSAIAGVGLATIVLNVAFSVFNFLCISITPLVANSIAADSRPYAASRVISTGLFLALCLGLTTCTTLLIAAKPICLWLGATAEALPQAVVYLRVRALASPMTLMSLVCNGALRGFKDLRTPFAVALFANFLNVVLDVLLIFQFGLGVAGAAWATSISQFAAVIAMFVALRTARRLRFIDALRIPKVKELKPMLGAGLMFTIRTLSLLTTIAYATATAAAKGVISLAAYELCRQLWIFKATVLDSFAAAAQTLVASAMARGETRRARLVANRSVQLAAMGGTVLGIAAVMAGPALPGLFTASDEVARVAANCIRMAAICAPLNGAVFAIDGVLTACCDYRYMAGGIALASFIACVALTAVRSCGGGVVAVWGGLNLLMVARAAVLFGRYVSPSSPIPAAAREVEPEALEGSK